MKSTQAMRDRIRELMSREQDDYDRAVECVLDDLEALLGSAQKPSINPADLWERYLAETENPSPQGAMAFAVEALSNHGASK